LLIIVFLSIFEYVLGMGALDRFVDGRLIEGRSTFSREEAEAAVGLSKGALTAALARLARRKRVISPRRGFFVILRPEDQGTGAPDPAQWIDPLMRFAKLDYRVSLLRAAAFHGSSRQAAMVFQVVVPRQLPPIEAGRHRIDFIYQAPASFSRTNRQDHLAALKTDAGYARVAGVELTLLDCVRYFHRAGGIGTAAQIAADLGGKADSRKIAALASAYESSCARRLGYLLELAGHGRKANALAPFAAKAKTAVPLDPSVKPVGSALSVVAERSRRWKLILNERMEADS